MKNSGSSKFIVITIILTIIAIAIIGFLLFNEKSITNGVIDPRSSIGSFFPFGNNNNNGDRTLPIENPIDNTNDTFKFPLLRKLTDTPTAGATAFQRGDDIVVRYVEKNTGHIYELPMSSQEGGVRLLNRTVPGIHDALWQKNGRQVIIRFLNENNIIKSYSTTVPNTEPTSAPESIFLPDNLSEILPSQSSANILYLYNEDDNSYGELADFTNTNINQLFSSNFQEWLLDWPNNSTITATPKPSYNIEGHTYIIDTDNNTFNKIFGNKPALITKMNPYADKLIYSTTGELGHSFGVYNIETNKDLKIAITTTPDKCVWSALDSAMAYCSTPRSFEPAGFPDTWYKGQVSFIDSAIWYINTETLELNSIRFVDNTPEEIDAIKFFMDSNETYLYFFNKKDMSLWSYELKEQAAIEIEDAGTKDINTDFISTSSIDIIASTTDYIDGE